MAVRWPWRRENRDGGLSLEEWASYFTFGGLQYQLGFEQTLAGQKVEEIPAEFSGLVQHAYRSNGVVFACMLVRQLVFSEARFQFRQLRAGRPGDLFGTSELALLERPWPGGTTGDLLTRAIQDVDLAGNFFVARRPDRLRRLRPDWMTILLGVQGRDADATDIDAEVVGYLYHPGGRHSEHEPVSLLPNQVAHFAPIPDPLSNHRGMSWLTPVIREIMGDKAATEHKLRFFESGGTPNLVVKLDPEIREEQFKRWIKLFEARHEGVVDPYETLYLGGGADATVVGSTLEQAQFKETQGAGETRIAAAAGVPPVIVGLSEGLEAATYSNYGQARRRFADGTIRPLWRNFAGSLSQIIEVPASSELWYDDRDIPFVREDGTDAAQIQQIQAASVKSLIDAGFTPESVIDAVTSGDFARLEHTGLFSVQLQEPGAEKSMNGSGQLPAGLIEQEE